MQRKLILNTIMSLILQITTVICGFILPRLIISYYGSETNGLTQSIAQFLGIISFLELGVGQVIQSSLYKPLANGDADCVNKILKSGTIYFRKIALVILGYILILGAFSPYIFKDNHSWLYITILIFAMSISSLSQYCCGLIDSILLSADQKGYIQFSAKILTNILNVVILTWLIRQGSSIHIVKIASAAIFVIGPIIIRCYVNKHYKINRSIVYTEEPIKQKWNGLAQHIATVVLEGTDVVILTVFSTLSNVSIYSVYYMVISGVKQLYTAATAGIQSMIGELWAKKQKEHLKHVFEDVEFVLHFVVVFLFSCIAILIIPFVKVYTSGITDCNYIQPVFALVLTIAYAIRCLRTPYNILVLASGHYKQTQICHIIAAVLNIVISIVSILCWGLVGIAVGTLIAFSYQTIWMIHYTSKHLLERPIKKVYKQIVVDVLTVGLIFAFATGISLKELSYLGWFSLALQTAGIAICVIAVMMVLFYFPRVKRLFYRIKR